MTEYWIRERGAGRPGTRLRFDADSAALAFLRTRVREPFEVQRLRGLLVKLEPGGSVLHRMNDRAVLEAAARHLVSGGLEAVPRPTLPGAGFATGPSDPAGADDTVAEDVPAGEHTTVGPSVPEHEGTQPSVPRIAFRIVDDETGTPLSGVGLRLRLPGGVVRQVKTGARGLVQLDARVAGLIDLEALESPDPLEVVGLEEAALE